MKFLFSLITLIMLTESCNTPKEVVENSKETEAIASKPSREISTTKSDIVKDNYTKTIITYKALSRGTYEYIEVSEAEVRVSSDRNLKNIDTYTCRSSDWLELEKLLKNIDTGSLDKLKAPTDKRLFDGAAHATLSILMGDVIMMTPSFDHGYPPEEIKALVNKVLSIKENSAKH
ncbi:hypothetical protein [Winogradskyella sp. PE311]|uniref:hypothetical protein n=1 Tax=Winogradskyella sp. PE311 TaxID=3366943 RepID=UPI0039815FAD